MADATYGGAGRFTTAPAAKRYTVFVWFTQETAVDVINGDKYNALVDNSSHEAARPSSFHPAGVNVVFADGHARFLAETIEFRVYQQLCTTNDKKSQLKSIYSPLPPSLSDADLP
jgi:prepilin-type processing-associated H-X9-DG protein